MGQYDNSHTTIDFSWEWVVSRMGWGYVVIRGEMWLLTWIRLQPPKLERRKRKDVKHSLYQVRVQTSRSWFWCIQIIQSQSQKFCSRGLTKHISRACVTAWFTPSWNLGAVSSTTGGRAQGTWWFYRTTLRNMRQSGIIHTGERRYR